MNYFKQQKELQEGIENYFIPASVETLQKIHSDATSILITIKYRQEMIEATKNYIELTQLEESKQKQLLVLQNLVEEKQMLLNSYRKLMSEINKQVNAI